MIKSERFTNCAWQIHDQIVFTVKYRKLIFHAEATDIIHQKAEAITNPYTSEMEAIGCDKGYIHLLCKAHPKLTSDRIVQIFKNITARKIFLCEPAIKRAISGGEFLPDGFYVSTVVEGDRWDTVQKHIKSKAELSYASILNKV
jgi:REP element-mobilizing transposase RayT